MRGYFETLMTQLLSQWFWFLLQSAFICEADLDIKINQIMRAMTNDENLRQYRSKFSLIVELILAFNSSSSRAWEVKNLSLIFKQIASRYFKLLNIIIWIVRFILSLISKRLHQKLYSKNLYIVEKFETSDK